MLKWFLGLTPEERLIELESRVAFFLDVVLVELVNENPVTRLWVQPGEEDIHG